jgi:DNA repair protein RadC
MKIPNTVAEVKITYTPQPNHKVKITGSKDAEKVFRSIWNQHISYKESFYVLLLNRANIVLGYNLLSVGGTSGTVVDIKIILQLALKGNASGIIVAHNHPSGNLTPSQQDKRLTKKLKLAAELMDLTLLDHLIITEKTYYIMKDNLIV